MKKEIIITSALKRLIKHKQTQLDFTLSKNDSTFLLETLIEFNYRAVDKFIKGGKEHGDDNEGNFLQQVDHEYELTGELCDAVFYNAAAKKKRK